MIQLKKVLRDWMFGDYHAIQDKGRRTSPISTISSEDDVTTSSQRKKLIATTQQQRRNVELAQWIINVHLDSVARFSFQSRTGDRAFDRAFERAIKIASKRQNFDIKRRHSRDAALRLFEATRMVGGDVFALFSNTGRVAGIEPDRVHSKSQIPAERENVVHGVQKNPLTEEHIAYALWKRAYDTSYVWDRWVPADRMFQIGYFSRFDQDRGVSPLVTAINRVQDLYEGMAAMAIKTKFHAMFGIAIEGDDLSDDDEFDIYDSSTGNAPTSSSDKDDLEFDIQPGLRIKTDGKVKTIESQTPHSSYIDWSFLCVQVALLAADIPFSFFDSRKSSYSARYADIQRYEKSCITKREQLQEFLTEWTMRQLRMLVAERALELPNGMTLEDIELEGFEWVPGGIPFLDRKAETEAAISAIAANLDSWQRFAKRHGMDAFELADENAEMQKYFVEKGMAVYVGKPGQEQVGASNDSDDSNSTNDTDEEDSNDE